MTILGDKEMLGFDADEKLTREDIGKRFKELARVYHPDLETNPVLRRSREGQFKNLQEARDRLLSGLDHPAASSQPPTPPSRASWRDESQNRNRRGTGGFPNDTGFGFNHGDSSWSDNNSSNDSGKRRPLTGKELEERSNRAFKFAMNATQEDLMRDNGRWYRNEHRKIMGYPPEAED